MNFLVYFGIIIDTMVLLSFSSFVSLHSCENGSHNLVPTNDTKAASFWPREGRSQTSAASTMPVENKTTTTNSEYPNVVIQLTSEAPAKHPGMVTLEDLDPIEEMPESSKEVEAAEKILPHRGWNPIKYR